MGSTLLSDILDNLRDLGLDDVVFARTDGDICEGTEGVVMHADAAPDADPPGLKSLLMVQQLIDIIDSLEFELGRSATFLERIRAIEHYMKYDAYIPIRRVE